MTQASWEQLATDQAIATTQKALEAHGMRVFMVETGAQAKAKALELLPKNAQVMTMTSVTLETIGLAQEINESGNYDAVHKTLAAMDRKTQGREMQQLGAAPDWAIGSVHALTQEGEALIASATGSQLPAYAYGASHVIWVVGVQKIVKNLEEGMRRIREYTLPLESERARKAYGVPGSAVNKMLMVRGEVNKERISVILVKEKLGF